MCWGPFRPILPNFWKATSKFWYIHPPVDRRTNETREIESSTTVAKYKWQARIKWSCTSPRTSLSLYKHLNTNFARSNIRIYYFTVYIIVHIILLTDSSIVQIVILKALMRTNSKNSRQYLVPTPYFDGFKNRSFNDRLCDLWLATARWCSCIIFNSMSYKRELKNKRKKNDIFFSSTFGVVVSVDQSRSEIDKWKSGERSCNVPNY